MPKWAICWRSLFAVPLAIAAVGQARAQGESATSPLTVSLEYDVPGECPSESEFRALVTRRIGRDPFLDGHANHVLVVISPSEDALSGKLVWRDNLGNLAGEQLFPSRTRRCEQLIAAMGFALAVQIQLLEVGTSDSVAPDRAISHEPPRSKAAAGRGRASTAHTPPALVVSDRNGTYKSENHSARPRVALGGGGALMLGMSSQAVPAGRVFASVRWPVVATELGVEVSAPVTVRRADGAGFSQWYLLASAGGCALAEPFRACAVFKVGTVRVSGRQIDVPNEMGAALVQSGLRLSLSQRVGTHAYFLLRGEGLANLTRWSVTLDHVAVWSSGPLAFDSGLDFMVLFR